MSKRPHLQRAYLVSGPIDSFLSVLFICEGYNIHLAKLYHKKEQRVDIKGSSNMKWNIKGLIGWLILEYS